MKTNSDHEVPLSKPVLTLLRTMRKTAPDDDRVWPGMTYDICVWHFTRICKAAGIQNMRRYDLRHSFASNVISAGFTLSDVGALLGHTTAQTTMRYAHLTNTRLREATEAAGKAVGQLSAKRPRVKAAG